jgi:alkaline phosphatase/alkaline phosphatase D
MMPPQATLAGTIELKLQDVFCSGREESIPGPRASGPNRRTCPPESRAPGGSRGFSGRKRAGRRAVMLAALVRGLVGFGAGCLAPMTAAAEIYHAQGELAGEPGADSVILQSRLTASETLNEQRGLTGAPGVARFVLDRGSDGPATITTPWVKAESANDYIVRQVVNGLAPNTRYRYRLQFGRDENSTRFGPPRYFTTLPGPRSNAALSFLMFNCMGWGQYMDGYGSRKPYDGPDKLLGYPTLTRLQRYADSHFFICAGDCVYYDTPREATARTLAEMRIKWQQQFSMPRLVQFVGSMGSFWMKDDHDFRYDDADLTGTREPSAALGIRVFKEQIPVVPREDFDRPTYRTVRANAQVQLWFLEGRDYRSPNAMEDGPAKSIWGVQQREWLQRTLRGSDATWKLIITPTPMVGPTRTGSGTIMPTPAASAMRAMRSSPG